MDMGESLQGEIKAKETTFDVCPCDSPMIRAYTSCRTSLYKSKRWYRNGTSLLPHKTGQIHTHKTRET